MTTAEFLAFREAMALKLGLDEKILSERKTAVLIGANRDKIHRWSTTHDPPLFISYACRAILDGRSPWAETDMDHQERIDA